MAEKPDIRYYAEQFIENIGNNEIEKMIDAVYNIIKNNNSQIIPTYEYMTGFIFSQYLTIKQYEEKLNPLKDQIKYYPFEFMSLTEAYLAKKIDEFGYKVRNVKVICKMAGSYEKRFCNDCPHSKPHKKIYQNNVPCTASKDLSQNNIPCYFSTTKYRCLKDQTVFVQCVPVDSAVGDYALKQMKKLKKQNKTNSNK